MGRYIGPKLRIERRLNGLVGFTTKTSKRSGSAVKSGGAPKKQTEYCIRLKEKQKLKYNYGVLEKQLFNYMCKAKRLKGSATKNLMNLIEMRLDCIVYRLGLSSSIPAARQLVNHGHIAVNGKRVSIPSYGCVENDTISMLKENSELENFGLGRKIPDHLELDINNKSGKVLSTECTDYTIDVNEGLIIEYYSRKL